MSLLVNIKKYYRGFTLEANFKAENGIAGFLGASGSGKSVTLRCIAGIETPDEGRIVLNGEILFDSEKKINLPPQKRRVGYLFQNYSLFPNMTLEKNLTLGAHCEKNSTLRRQKVQEMIRKLELTGMEHKYPRELSGGQQQRGALARILLNEPKILLLDEPFSALDAYLRDRLVADLKGTLLEYGRQVILVSHSRDEIYRLCSEVALVSHGRVRELQPVKKVFASPGTVEGAILTGCKNIVSAEKFSEYQVYVPEWRQIFETSEPVRDNLTAIGIRAHYFSQKAANAVPVELLEEIEEPFEWILKFRYRSAEPGAPAIWWRMPKENRPKEFPESLGTAPQNLMLLYPEE